MSSKIRVLDEHTINKIAAGEVIENPASVVKELVENALDAGSTEVCVEIKGGGRQLIRVTDNGCGMSSDDALLCLERHATSKIRSVEEIHELMTMGFRGEAIPSIAAISKFSILTRQFGTENSEGTMVLVEGGKILKCCPVACSAGTTMEVKSLFFNIPVRKKFQKSPAHDAADILKMMTLLSLGHPSIKFRLINDQETLLSAPKPFAITPLEQMKERIGAVLGGDYIEGCIPIEGVNEEYQIRGWIGMPYHHRQNRTGQYLFINNRGIQSPLVSFAVKDGYGTTIPAQRHPIYVLHISILGRLVDVNVHPQKREVRLRQEQTLREMVVGAVREGLQKSGNNQWIFSSIPEQKAYTISDEIFTPIYMPEQQPIQTPIVRPVFSSEPMVKYDFTVDEKEGVARCEKLPESKFIFNASKPLKNIPRVIACVPGYILLEQAPEGVPSGKEGMCLIDQRSAHARVIFEQLCRHRANSPLEVENFLIPHTIELAPVDAEKLRRSLHVLEPLGVCLKEFGRSSFLLDGLPAVMGNIDPAAFIHEIVASLNEGEEAFSFLERIDRQIALAAVRASVSKNRRLSTTEGQSLVQQLFECDVPWYCPQGKPVAVTISLKEISKYFS